MSELAFNPTNEIDSHKEDFLDSRSPTNDSEAFFNQHSRIKKWVPRDELRNESDIGQTFFQEDVEEPLSPNGTEQSGAYRNYFDMDSELPSDLATSSPEDKDLLATNDELVNRVNKLAIEKRSSSSTAGKATKPHNENKNGFRNGQRKERPRRDQNNRRDREPNMKRDRKDFPSKEQRSRKDEGGNRENILSSPPRDKQKNRRYEEPNERDKKSSNPNNLWQSNRKIATKEDKPMAEPKQIKMSTKELLGRNPTVRDLNEVVFSSSNTFQVGEIVLSPRTRGGFSYGKITKQILRTNCFFDQNVEHNNYVWRVVYYSNGKSLFKDLPAPYLGKLPRGTPSISEADLAMTFRAEANSNYGPRIVGDKPNWKDLNSVVFSPQCTFTVDEVVLVPRSKGGFSYGRIVKETKNQCKITVTSDQDKELSLSSSSSSHSLHGWRIIVSEESNNVNRKDLPSAFIGKILMTNSTSIPGLTHKSRRAIFASSAEVPENANELATLKESEIIEASASRHEDEDDKSPSGVPNENDDDLLEDEIVLWSGTDNINPSSAPGNTVEIPTTGAPLKKSEEETSTSQPPVAAPSTNDATSTTATTPVIATPFTKTQVPVQQIGGIISVDKGELLRRLMGKQKQPKEPPKKHLIVLDGPNIARKHGKDTEFSSEGIAIALKYWNDKGHDSFAFLPEHYVKRKPGQGQVTLQEYLPKAKNIPLLMDLIERGKVVLTPPQDYDDSYCIEYAMTHNACIVTNDRYWDHVEKQQADKGFKAKRETKKWLRDHLISFTFVRDEFLPNPNFKFPPIDPSKDKE